MKKYNTQANAKDEEPASAGFFHRFVEFLKKHPKLHKFMGNCSLYIFLPIGRFVQNLGKWLLAHSDFRDKHQLHQAYLESKRLASLEAPLYDDLEHYKKSLHKSGNLEKL